MQPVCGLSTAREPGDPGGADDRSRESRRQRSNRVVAEVPAEALEHDQIRGIALGQAEKNAFATATTPSRSGRSAAPRCASSSTTGTSSTTAPSSETSAVATAVARQTSA